MLRTRTATSGTVDLPSPVQRMVLAYLHHVAVMIAHFIELGRQRRALAELDERLLRDVGLNRSVAAREVRKHSWQL